jgi:hypothetical protein
VTGVLFAFAVNFPRFRRPFEILYFAHGLLFVAVQGFVILRIWRQRDGDVLFGGAPCIGLLVEMAFLATAATQAVLWMFYAPWCALLYLYSGFLPQIVMTAWSGEWRKSIDGTFTVLTTANRLLFLVCFFVWKPNIFGAHEPGIACAIAAYLVGQAVVVLLQNRFGGQFFLPLALRAALFDYAAGRVGPGTNCSICLGEIDAEDETMVTPCGHGFHKECLGTWMHEQMICPVCRARLPVPQEEHLLAV